MGVLNIFHAAIACLAVLIAAASYRYLFGDLAVPPLIAANRFRFSWLAMHAGFAATALLVGAAQFSRALRKARPALHRRVGRIYAVSCLIGAVAGFVLAIGSSAGPIASVGFGALAIAWSGTTLAGWRYALLRDFTSHRAWMIRSWALTLSAVTLRIYLFAAETAGLPQLPAYQAIAFLCWVPNLLAAEVLLQRGSGSHSFRKGS